MSEPVLIAGGGIGGLAAALALAEYGTPSRVYERRTNPAEEGAGIQLGPNGTRILKRLGIARRLEAATAKPDALTIMAGQSGREITTLPLGAWIEARHGAPYWTAHRQDLHAALRERAEQSSLIDIVYGASVQSAEADGDQATAILEGGERIFGPVLIGADGISSSLRRTAMGAEAPVFTGKIAMRAVIEAADIDPLYVRNVHIWLAPGAHVVHYPVRAGKELALVVIIDGEDEEDGWASPVEPQELAAKTARLGLAKPLQDLLARPLGWRLWSLKEQRCRVPFAKGRIALLGDSAHPVLPFLAQGAVLALEDAEALAAALHAAPASPEGALSAYAARRRPRAARVVRASAMNGRIYHLEGPAASARNLVLAVSPGTRIMAGLDWLYGYRL